MALAYLAGGNRVLVVGFLSRPTFLARQKKRIFLFFLWGDLVQNRTQTRKSRAEVPERGDLGEENCLGKGGVDKAKKGKKDAQRKVG